MYWYIVYFNGITFIMINTMINVILINNFRDLMKVKFNDKLFMIKINKCKIIIRKWYNHAYYS